MSRAQTLVLVPGLGLGPEAWSPTVAALGHRGEVRCEPLPGCGRPAARQADLHPAALAEVLLERLAQDRPLVLFGHSHSCQVAAHAARLGGRVSGLVLVGPTTDPAAQTWPRLALRWLRTARHETPGQLPVVVPLYRRTGLGTMARAMSAALGDSIVETLRRTTCPVLVVRGRFDRICSGEWAASVARGRGRAVTLASGAHMVPLTHGKLVAAAARELISGL